jgi:hypothetical protein
MDFAPPPVAVSDHAEPGRKDGDDKEDGEDNKIRTKKKRRKREK